MEKCQIDNESNEMHHEDDVGTPAAGLDKTRIVMQIQWGHEVNGEIVHECIDIEGKEGESCGDILCRLIDDIYDEIYFIQKEMIDEEAAGDGKYSDDRRRELEGKIGLLTIKRRQIGLLHSKEMMAEKNMEWQKDAIEGLSDINETILCGILDLSDFCRFDFSDAELMALELHWEFSLAYSKHKDYYATQGDSENSGEWLRETLHEYRLKTRECFGFPPLMC